MTAKHVKTDTRPAPKDGAGLAARLAEQARKLGFRDDEIAALEAFYGKAEQGERQ